MYGIIRIKSRNDFGIISLLEEGSNLGNIEPIEEERKSQDYEDTVELDDAWMRDVDDVQFWHDYFNNGRLIYNWVLTRFYN